MVGVVLSGLGSGVTTLSLVVEMTDVADETSGGAEPVTESAREAPKLSLTQSVKPGLGRGSDDDGAGEERKEVIVGAGKG